MNHELIAAVVLPLLTATVLLLVGERLGLRATRWVSLSAAAALLGVCVRLVFVAAGDRPTVYAIGEWSAPYGILLILDRLSALMLLLTAGTALPALWYASCGTDRRGRHFHPLVHFQLVGLNGAVLTGDLFNLFVFFEVLLIASYALLLHGGGPARVRAGLHYVVLNLVGSALFLLAMGLLYRITGTLNLARLAERAIAAPAESRSLIDVAAWLLFVVFALKGAIAPLFFWLPAAYGAASGAVAALFTVLTKIGIYAIVRLFSLLFGWADSPLAPWLLPLGALTLLAGAAGALAARGLRRLVAYLVVSSIGMVSIGIGLWTEAGVAGAIYYLVHTTLLTAGLFLLAELVSRQRGAQNDLLACAPAVRPPRTLGGLYVLGAAAVAGIPPLSGFVGKLLLLQAALVDGHAPFVWGAVLAASLLTLTALGHAGSMLFWKTRRPIRSANPAHTLELIPAAALLFSGLALVVFTAPLFDYIRALVAQIGQPADYIAASLSH